MYKEKLLLTNFLVVLDDNATNDEILAEDEKEKVLSRELGLIEKGYVFNKTLSDDVFKALDELLPLRKEIIVLFKRGADIYHKIAKVFIEYLFYGKENPWRETEEITKAIQMVRVLNKKEFTEYCNELARQDKAFDQELLEEMVPHLDLPLDEIKNKELQILYMKENIGKKQFSGYSLIRFINYLITGETLFIDRNKDGSYREYTYKFDDLKEAIEKMTLVNEILKSNEFELAKYYNTYRDTFVALKRFAKSKGELKMNIPNHINRIMNIARTKAVNQKNLTIKYDIDIFFSKKPMEEIKAFLKEKTLKELLKLWQIMKNEEYFKSQGVKSYTIRNGRIFMKRYTGNRSFDMSHSLLLANIIKEKFNELLEKWQDKIEEEIEKENIGALYEEERVNAIYGINLPEKFVLPKEYDSPVVFSQKKSSAGVYFGSSFPIKKGYKIGIKWEQDIDIDLSCKDIDTGKAVVWNARWSIPGLEYSGDCRTAGSEYIEITDLDSINNLIFNANLYFGDKNDTMRIFILDEDNNMIYESDDIYFDKNEMVIGYILDEQFVLDVRTLTNRNVKYTRLDGREDKLDYDTYLANLPIIKLEELLDLLSIPYEKVSKSDNEFEYLYNLI